MLRWLPFRSAVFRALSTFLGLIATVLCSGGARAELEVGLNLDSVSYWSPEPKFVDVIKSASGWTVRHPWGSGTAPDWLSVRYDADGWPTSLPIQALRNPTTGRVIFDGGGAPIVQSWKACLLILRGMEGHWPLVGEVRADGKRWSRWLISWEGKGELELRYSESRFDDATKPPGYERGGNRRNALEYDPDRRNEVASGGSVEIEIAESQAGVDFCIASTDASDPMRRVRMVPVAYRDRDTDGDPESVFWPQFVDRLRAFPGPLRMADVSHVNYTPVSSWASRPKRSLFAQGTERGVALEYQIMLANLAGSDLWLTLPHASTDSYIAGTAALVSAQLDPSLRVIPQWGNELWNGADPFGRGGRYALEQGRASGICQGVDDGVCVHRFTAYRQHQIHDTFASVLGEERVVRLHAGHAASPWVFEKMMEWNPVISLVAEVYATAPYFCHGPRVGEHPLLACPEFSPHCEIQLEDGSYPDVDGNGAEDFKQIALPSAHEIALYCLADVEAVARPREEANRAMADRWNVELWAYEGGQHLVLDWPWRDRFPELRQRYLDAQADPAMGAATRAYLEMLEEVGYRKLPYYKSIGTWAKYGAWGMAPWLDAPRSEAPKLDAVLDFVEARER